jgi:hypothetical protein
MATMSDERADKIEAKVDVLIIAVNKLALIDERQIEAGKRMGAVEDRIAKAEVKIDNVDRRVDKWINRGIGIWGVVGFLFAVYQTFKPFLHP